MLMNTDDKTATHAPALWPLWAEYSLIFLILPLVLAFYPQRFLVLPILWLVTLYALFVLARSPDYSGRRLWFGHGVTRRWVVIALARFAVCAAAMFVLTKYWYPEWLFQFPLKRPQLWLIVMVLYPLLSAMPQELAYRSFFFQRYQSLFPRTEMMVLVNCLSFAFLHIMMANWVAPILSLIGSVIFTLSYRTHRSLLWASIEHGLYGCALFTIGLGRFFVLPGFHG